MKIPPPRVTTAAFYGGLATVSLLFLPGVPHAFSVPKVAGLLVAAALMIPGVIQRYRSVQPVFVLQALSLVLCTLWSVNPAVSLWGGDWRRMGFVTGIAILIAGAAVPIVLGSARSRWLGFVRLVAGAGALAAAYGLLQWLNLDPFLPGSLREALIEEFGGVYRSIGPIGQPTYFANYLLYPLFCSVALVCIDRSRTCRVLAAITAGLTTAAILTTMSRGAILGVLAGCLVLVCSAGKCRKVIGGLALASVLVLGLALVVLQTPTHGAQLRARLEYIRKDTSGGGRLTLWSDLTQRVLPDYWLAGTGPGMFRTVFARERTDRYSNVGPDIHWETAHNLFLDRWTEQGLPGLLMLVACIMAVTRNMRHVLRATVNARERWAIAAVSSAFFAAIADSMFNGEVVPTAYYLCVWTGLSFATRNCFGPEAAPVEIGAPTKFGRLVLVPAVAVSLLLVWHAGNHWFAETGLARAIAAAERGDESGFLRLGRESAHAFPERGTYGLEFSNLALRYIGKHQLPSDRRREIAEIGIDYGLRATTGDKAMLALFTISELGSHAGDPRTEAWLRRLISDDPYWYRSRKLLAATLLERRQLQEAQAQIAEAKRLGPYDTSNAQLGKRITDALSASEAHPQAKGRTRLAEMVRRTPLSFEQNIGQAPPEVEYLARTAGYSVFMSHGSAILVGSGTNGTPDSVKMHIAGGDPQAAAEGTDKQKGQVHYFMTADPARWQTGVPLFGKVAYHDIYPGIDLLYYGNQTQLEYDFVVSPGADPSKIGLAFEGDIESITTDFEGNLNVRSRSGIVQLRKPLTYQIAASGRREIPSRLVVEGRRARFEVDRYDPGLPLTIDPVILYSTYLAGAGDDLVPRGSMALDVLGNAYIAGRTTSLDFPRGVAGSSVSGSAFVSKLDASAPATLYTTYLGTGDSAAAGIAVDASGFAYLTGSTSQTDFPVTTGVPQSSHAGSLQNRDAFITKLSPAGTLTYSTYWGGSGDDWARAIAIDASGEAVISGLTESLDFPPVHAIQSNPGGVGDAFVTKIAANGSILYSTFLGGNALDTAFGVALDKSGSAYISGFTESGNFPLYAALQSTVNDAQNAFVTRIDASGDALVFSTYLGGGAYDAAFGMTLDSFGNAFVVGSTFSGDFPNAVALTTPHGAGDGFIVKIPPDGDTLLYSTYIGGTAEDTANAVAVDVAGNAYITGFINSDVAAMTPAPFQEARAGLSDAYLLKLNPAGSTARMWTYLGGTTDDSGQGLAVDASGNAHLSIQTLSSDFPVSHAIRATAGGGYDVAVVKLATVGDLAVTVQTSSFAFEGSQISYTITVRNNGPGVAADVTLNASVPLGAAFVSLTSSQGSCSAPAQDGTLSCALGTIDAGSSVTVTLELTVSSPRGSSITTGVSVGTSDDDLLLQNNAAQRILPVISQVTTGGPPGADVRAIVVDPVNPSTIYAATANGVYRTDDAGGYWNKAGLVGTYVRCLVIDPSNPEIVYAGTGSQGVFRTSNKGGEWTPVNSGINGPAFGLYYDISDMVIDESAPATLYAATFGGGVFETTDSGGTWTAMNSGLSQSNIWTIEMNPMDSNTLYVGTPAGVFKTIDGGSNWNTTNSGLAFLEVDALAIDPVNPNTIYAGGFSNISKSTNGGANWFSSSAGFPLNRVNGLTVVSSIPSIVYAATQAGVYRSTNSGGTWNLMSSGLAGNIPQAIAVSPADSATVYAATQVGVFKSTSSAVNWTPVVSGMTYPYIHALKIHPLFPFWVLAGTQGGGIFSTVNGGISWSSGNTGLVTPYIQSLALDPTASVVHAATQNGIYRSANGGSSWSLSFAAPSIEDIVVAPSASSTVYAASLGNGVVKSTNSGVAWTSVSSGLVYPASYVYSLAVHPTDPSTVYAGTGNGVFKTTNGGTTWTPSGTFPLFTQVRAIAISPTSPNTVFAGTDNGIYKTANGGTSWVVLSSSIDNINSRAIAVHPQTSETLYAGTTTGMLISIDGGANWALANSGLSDLDVRSAAIDPSNPNIVYAGTAFGGVFKTLNGGGTWQPTRPSLGNTPGAATRFTKISGDDQTGIVGQQLRYPFVVAVLNDFGDPVAGTGIGFFLTSGSGTLSSSGSVTATVGIALSWLTPGNAGSQTVFSGAGLLTGSPVTFTSTATMPPLQARRRGQITSQ